MLETLVYEAPVVKEERNTEAGITKVTILIEDEEFTGTAKLHPDDADFDSKRVGRKIALSRARIRALLALGKQARQILAKEKRSLYRYIRYQDNFVKAIKQRRKILQALDKARNK